MAIELYKGEERVVIIGPFLDDTDGRTPKTTLTIANTDIKIWKAHATSLVSKNSGGATHMANGHYYITLDPTDTSTVGSLVITCHMAGALPVQRECYVKRQTDYIEINFWRNCVFLSAAAGGTTTTVPISSVFYSDIPAQTTNGAYVGMMLWAILTGGLSVHRVTGYVGATKVLTIDPPLATAPADGQYFILLPGAPGVLADNAITAAKVATDAIDNDALAASAVTEIQSGLATSAALATVNAYVDELESRLTAGRAGYLDNLSGGAVATAAALAAVSGLVDDLEGRLSAARAGYLDSLNSGVPLSAGAVDAIIDEVVEGSTTLRQAVRLMLASLVGKASGGGTSTVSFRDLADTKNRVVMTTDTNGNRTAVTRDAT